jgi:acetylornithine deacetylase/succinyl-diaminopimelate desuccinylase-like protein
MSIDVRGVDEEAFRGVANDIAAFADDAARKRGMTATFAERQNLPATQLDEPIVAALEAAARNTNEPYMTMASGAAHDTMCVADHVPSAMVFVPCKDGISHSPLEEARPADAALAAEIIINAIRTLA